MRYFFIFIFSIFFMQYSMSDALKNELHKFKQNHVYTDLEWDKIRLRNAGFKVKESDSIIFHEKKMIAPGKGNVHIFQNEEQKNDILDLFQDSAFSGYVIYPYWMEQQYKLTEKEVIKRKLKNHGFMNMVVSSVSKSVESKMDSVMYFELTSGDISYEASSEEMDFWLNENSDRNLYNLKSYFLYVENPDTLLSKEDRLIADLLKKEADSLSAKLTRKCPYVIIPYWKVDAYKELYKNPAITETNAEKIDPRRNISRMAYLAYVIDPQTGMPMLRTNIMDSSRFSFSKRVCDLMAVVEGVSATDMFISRPDCWKTTLKQIFAYPNGMVNNSKAIGVNFYFPDFDFKRKKEMTQFVKTASLVVDSFRVENKGLIYGDPNQLNGNRYLDLFLTFNRKEMEEHYDFISGLQCFVDGIYFADFDEDGVPVCVENDLLLSGKENTENQASLFYDILYDNGTLDTSSFFCRIVNPFYLLKIPYKKVDETSVMDIDLLLDCDYNSGRWGIFLTIDIILILILLLYVILLRYSTEINIWRSRYYTFFVLAVITLVAEAIVFFLFLLEALSPQQIFFHFRDGSYSYLVGMALPVVPILIYFIMHKMSSTNKIP